VTKEVNVSENTHVEIEWLQPKFQIGVVQCQPYANAQEATLWWDCILYDVTQECLESGSKIIFPIRIIEQARRDLVNTEPDEEGVLSVCEAMKAKAQANIDLCSDARQRVRNSTSQHIEINIYNHMTAEQKQRTDI
jgi:hypothetical protein